MEIIFYLVAGAILFIAVPVLCERYSPLVVLGGLILIGTAWKLLS